MPSLLSFLDPQNSWATQTSAGDFMKAIITVSANASQNEQACIGPNELTRQLVSKPCVSRLISYMLGGGNALTVGVGIVIEVIRKNNSDYDPEVCGEANSVPASRDPIYLGTLLRMFAENVPNFMNLIMNAPAQKARLDSTFGDKIEPLGFDRIKTCELMAELLHCSNMGLLNAVGSEELIAARDDERRRLRVEGRLTAVRGEEPHASADDLTMRISHSSAVDEGRRLEITNISDDDGFEEVTHSADLVEDTSHEFVRAEEDMPAALPTTTKQDKDDDDFVEEPLSSPRLHVHDAKPGDGQFDEPDLVVAPLSPSKTKEAADSDAPGTEKEGRDPKAEEAAEKIEVLSLDEKLAEPESTDDQEPEKLDLDDNEKGEKSDSTIVFTPTISSIAEAEEPGTEAEPAPAEKPATAAGATEDVKGLSAHPDDTPAPPSCTEPANPTAPAEPAEKTEPTADAPAEGPADAKDGVETDANELGPGEASIIVGHQVEQAQPPLGAEASQLDPVVGDFLKMQFVELRGVPTILVSLIFLYNLAGPTDPD